MFQASLAVRVGAQSVRANFITANEFPDIPDRVNRKQFDPGAAGGDGACQAFVRFLSGLLLNSVAKVEHLPKKFVRLELTRVEGQA
jgi:hypothetical protein